MSSYIERYCEKHGVWEQDVDHPSDECPDCEEEGIAPSQVRNKELARLRARIAALETVEWVEQNEEEGYSWLECPWCEQKQSKGHAPDCPRGGGKG